MFSLLGNGKKLNVKRTKAIIVMNDKKKVLVKFNNVDETIAGTTKKIIKGFVTPPVKYIKTANCITS